MKMFQTLTGIVFTGIVVLGSLFLLVKESQAIEKNILKQSPTALQKSLMTAVKIGDIKQVGLLLDRGADVNMRVGEEMMTPLMVGVESGCLEVVRLLLDKGAMVNAKNKSGETALLDAVNRKGVNAVEIVRMLLERGADVHVRNALGGTALVYARSVEIEKLLLDKGADVNGKEGDSVTPLMSAVCGSFEMVKLLLDKGADVNARNKEVTALIRALEEGEDGLGKDAVAIVKLLLEKGADVNGRSFPESHNESPLMFAAISGHPVLVEMLLDKGAEVNASDIFGRTALMHAAAAGVFRFRPLPGESVYSSKETFIEILKLLLAKGADVNAKDKSGKTVLMYAAIPEIKNLLRSAGAKE